MENISSVQNSYQVSPELQKKIGNQENFAALDKEKLKQDTVDIKNKTIENANENWIFRKLKDFGVEDPKKLLKSIAYTVLTVVGVATLGNKLSTPSAKLGEKVDDFLLNGNGIASKIYSGISGIFQKGKDTLSKIPKHSKTLQDIQETVKNHPVKAKNQWARGYERGPIGIFMITVNDTFSNVKNKIGDVDFNKALKNLVGDDADTIKKINDLIEQDSTINAQEFLPKLTEKIIAHAKKMDPSIANKSNSEILELLRKNSIKGIDVSDFTNVKMVTKGPSAPMSSWWPVNIIDKIGKKFNKNFSFCQGDLFDSLTKFNAINGTGTKTLPGKLIQKVPTLSTECISNFVNDKSGLGECLQQEL